MNLNSVIVLVILTLGIKNLFADETKMGLSPTISKKGDLIFSDDFDELEIKPEWYGKHGTQWAVVDGVLQGRASSKEYQAEKIAQGDRAHSGMSPTGRLLVPVDDGIVLFRFKVTDALAEAHFGFDDGKNGTQHVGRFIVSRKIGLAIQKDKNAKLKGDKKEVLSRGEFELKSDIWYWVMIEVVGEAMVAQISDGPTLRAKHPRFGIHKGHINLPNRGAGGVICYDQVRIWKAIPMVGKSM